MTTKLATTTLGRTGIEVTRLGYGAAHRKPMTEEENQAMVKRVVDSGINYIDTANDYGNSEEMIGLSVSERKPEFTIATKCGCAPSGHIWTRANLFRGLEESLRRLKVDVIDVMQLHNPTVAQCEEGKIVDALQEMRALGKVRWIGVSATLPHLPTFLDWGVFDVFQIPYSALERRHEEWLTRIADAGMGVVVRGGVNYGEPGVGKGSAAQWNSFADARLDELLSEGESRTAFMLRFTLSHPAVHTTIVGTTNPDHLRENVEAAERGPLPDDVYAEAKRRLDAVGPTPTPAPA